MLWSCVLSELENKLLDPKYTSQTNKSNSIYIAVVVEYLGVKVKTILNYVDAITEITNKEENWKCIYYKFLLCVDLI